ncbi:hypothetical protein DFJ77DRAFT_92858 [Powellomyces hirtus]|nr:hypothetical protein DFJ77DRAFT_282595 [Powellomyces hirtus]KAI8911273.1 hypothetical protein DFJ77DRAFT_92858 [Powellomyces hirtus]
MFEERVSEVTSVLDHYEQLHLSTQSPSEIRSALIQLHAQNLVLMRAADEEQLVDEGEQEDLQGVYMRLFRVITIYEDFMTSLKAAGADSGALDEDYSAGAAAKLGDGAALARSESFKLNLSIGGGLDFGSVSEWLHKVGIGEGEAEGDLGVTSEGAASTTAIDPSPRFPSTNKRISATTSSSRNSSTSNSRQPAPPRSDSIRQLNRSGRSINTVARSGDLDASVDIGHMDPHPPSHSPSKNLSPRRESIGASEDIVNTDDVRFSDDALGSSALSVNVMPRPRSIPSEDYPQSPSGPPPALPLPTLPGEQPLTKKDESTAKIIEIPKQPQQQLPQQPIRSNSSSWAPSRDANAGS